MRPMYPYKLGVKHEKAGKQPSHTKKGPGRRAYANPQKFVRGYTRHFNVPG